MTQSSEIMLKLKNEDNKVVGDSKVIDHLSKHFYSFSQQIIETHYLQPLTQDNHGNDLPEKVKKNLKDAWLERSLHGGMHVGRVQFWVHILNEKIKTMLPDYTGNVFSSLSKSLGLSEKQIVTLTRYAALFHDSARKHEAQDKWDKQSSENCYHFLEKQGLSKKLAGIFSKAAAFKDKPAKYAEYLESQGVDSQTIESLQYVRKLIYLSDCYDIVRCVGNFRLENILKAFKNIKAFDPKAHTDTLLQILKEVYALIRKQNDMLFPCVIISPGKHGKEIDLSGGRSAFDLRKKVLIEHADNVCSVLGASINKDPNFKGYLKNEQFLETSLAKVKPAFNPHMHGTNSLSLLILKRTNFEIMSPLKMLTKHGMAPMGGEIEGLWRGGLGALDSTSHICFGRMSAVGEGEYGLKRIRESYTKYSVDSSTESWISSVKYQSDFSIKCAFENSNPLLIELARAKQMGCDPLKKKEHEDLDENLDLVKNLNSTIQLYYLIMLIGDKIHFNTELYVKYRDIERNKIIPSNQMLTKFIKRIVWFHSNGLSDLADKFTYNKCVVNEKKAVDDIGNSIYANLTFENLVKKIKDSGLNIEAIYHNPTKENLHKVLKLLSFPKEAEIMTGTRRKVKKQVVLPETQFFMLDKNNSGRNISGNKRLRHYGYGDLCKTAANEKSYKLRTLLADYCFGSLDPSVMPRFKKIIMKRVDVLKGKFKLLKKIVAIDASKVKFTEQEKRFLHEPFPMILICEDEEKIDLLDFSTQEYRAYESLKLGKDIKMIATDTQEHQLLVMKYLENNGVHDVQVILDAQLDKSQEAKKQPQSAYTHKDGFTLLSWLAARKAPDNTVTKDEKVNEIIDAASQYRGINFG